MVLVKPATVIQWHRKGFRLYWHWRSRRLGRPKMSLEARDPIRQMSTANPVCTENLNPDIVAMKPAKDRA
jgi:putative transposase